MFEVGDKVVYPLHGAGVIESLEAAEVDGEPCTYYVMLLPIGNLKIRISVEKSKLVGLRGVYTKQQVLDIIMGACGRPAENLGRWNQRYRENVEKIKSGDLLEAVCVYRDLLKRERDKGLSSAEKKMLLTTRQIVLSEVILSQNLERAQAEALLAAHMY